MAVTYIDHTGTQGQTDFAFNFDYLEDEHVTVEINGVAQLSSAYSVIVESNGDTKVRLNVGATAGQIVRVRRKSQPDTNLVDFVNGSVLTESELDRAYRHNRYLAEEIAELNDASLQIEAGGTNWDAKSLQIKNLADPTDTTDATTKTYVDSKVNQASTGTNFPPTKWVFTASSGANTTYSVTGAEIDGDTAYDVSIDGSVKEPTTDYTVDPDTDTLTIIPTLSGTENIVVIERGFGVALTIGSISGSQLENGSVTAVKISTTDPIFNVQSNGNVGIGTASPDAPLHTYKDNVNGYNIFEASLGGWVFGQAHDGDVGISYCQVGGLYGTHSGIAVNTSGDVGIRTTNPGYALDVAGDINVTGDFKVNGTNFAPTVADDSITFAKMQDINTAKVIGRTTAGSGDPEEVSILDEDAMTSNSDTALATQQSIKAYVDSQTVSKYTAAWNTSHGSVTVANGATLTITHNLGTTDIIYKVYVNSSASDTGAIDVGVYNSTSTIAHLGAAVTSSTTNTITLKLGVNGYVDPNTTTGVSYASKYIKVVVIG